MRKEPIKPALCHKSYRDIDSTRPTKILEQTISNRTYLGSVHPRYIMLIVHWRILRDMRKCLEVPLLCSDVGFISKVVAMPRNHVAYAAPGIGNVTLVAWDHMQMEVRNGLASNFSHIHTDVEACRIGYGQDDASGDFDSLEKRHLLLEACLEPVFDVAPGDYERVPGGHREHVPEAEDQVPLMKDSIGFRTTERAVHYGSSSLI